VRKLTVRENTGKIITPYNTTNSKQYNKLKQLKSTMDLSSLATNPDAIRVAS